MKIEVRLFPLDTPAADGSIVPKKIFLEYQSTTRYQERKQNKNFYGGSTHLNRNSSRKESSGGVVGESDELLYSGNITHIIDDYFIKLNPADGIEYVHATAEVMTDPDEYEGKSKELIKTLTRLLNRGVQLPVSVVISAAWRNDVAVRIKDILGFDFNKEM
jgi:hypothetical protein